MPSTPNLDQLIGHVREEAEHPHCQPNKTASVQPLPSLSTPAPQPVPSLAEPAINHVDDLLLQPHRPLFIARAYKAILGREADDGGLQHYQKMLERGFGQPFVLAALRASPEGRQHKQRIPGWGCAPCFYNCWRFGRFIGLGLPARWLNRFYHAWRHLRLAFSGRLLSDLTNQLHQLQTLLQQSVEHTNQHNQQLANHFSHYQSDWNQRLQRFTNRQQELAVHLQTLATRQHALDNNQRNVTELADNALKSRIDAYYLAFEEGFRSQEKTIQNHLQPHLQAISTLPLPLIAKPILDLGSGRGEWLDLLTEHGFSAQGVDSSAAMVTCSREQGHNIIHSDALSALQQTEDQSFAAISAFHLIEHLPFQTLYQIIEHAYRVVTPGGLLLLETPNPENILVSSHTFYHDFRHHNPVTPHSLDFLLGYIGFDQRQIIRLNPYRPEARIDENSPAADRINSHFYGSQDYLIIARRPLPVAAENAS